MMLPDGVRVQAFLLGCVLIVGALGCASTPPKAEPEPELEPAWDLYEQLEHQRARFLDGLSLVQNGERAQGEAILSQATDALVAMAMACDRRPGCEMSRFLLAFDGLLGAQDELLRSQAAVLFPPPEAESEDPERELGTSPFLQEMPELERGVALLRGTDLRELITLNGPVNAALDDWLTWLRPQLLESWTQYGYLRDQMFPLYEEAGLPEALLFAVFATESGGKVHAHSRSGAAGPLQFIRSTGRLYGLREVDGFDLRLDPEAATRANVAYLNDRFRVLDDNLEKALAAYNGGENRVRGLHRRLGGASLWDTRFYYSLPRETRDYVPRVLAAAWLFLHPERYGVVWPEIDPSHVGLEVAEPISLSELAVCLGQEQFPQGWFRVLRNLNPRLGPGERVEPGTELAVPAPVPALYQARCREGELLELARTLHDANYPDGGDLVIYVVQKGDTLGKIAARHRCTSIRALAEINRLRAPSYVIHVGQRLRIPRC